MSKLSHALSATLAKEAPPGPKRRMYEMSTSTRITALVNGKAVTVPHCLTVLRLSNLVVPHVAELGRFAFPNQAILFAVTGVLKWGDISLNDILQAKSRAGFVKQFGGLNEAQIVHLVNSHRVRVDLNRAAHELVIARLEQDDDFELLVETDGLMVEPVTTTGRKFR